MIRRQLGDEPAPSPTQEAIIALVADAGFGDMRLPGLVVTSAHRVPNVGDWHSMPPYLAVDFGSDGASPQGDKDAIAAWFAGFSGFLTELIHTQADGTHGWYVKSGSVVSPSFYGPDIVAAHVNHTHVALQQVGVDGIRAKATYGAMLDEYKRWLADRGADWM